LGPIPNPQSPIPNPQSPIPNIHENYFDKKYFKYIIIQIILIKKYNNLQMDKTINKELISDNYLNPGKRSSKSKTIKSDISQNSLLSSINDRKVKDRKATELKHLNSLSERKLNNQIKKQLEDNSIFSSKNNKSKNDTKKSVKNKNEKEKKKNLDKIIVDNIENIYSNISHLPNKLFWQKFILLLIVFYVSSIHWVFLFFTKRKMERDYCFTKLNQFESCVPEQFCSESFKAKIISPVPAWAARTGQR
jgi:hypothetical protein